VLLVQACRNVDELDQLHRLVQHDGLMVDGKVHPALVECRQLRTLLSRLVGSLRLPDEKDQRAQRRTAARGSYQPRSMNSMRVIE
jgi:hypothetical protein